MKPIVCFSVRILRYSATNREPGRREGFAMSSFDALDANNTA